MLTWQVGTVKITRVVELEIPVPYSARRPMIAEATPEALRQTPWLYPDFVNDQDQMLLSIHAPAAGGRMSELARMYSEA